MIPGALPPIESIQAHEVRFTYVIAKELVVVHSRQRLDLAWQHVGVPLAVLEGAVAELRCSLARGALGLRHTDGVMVMRIPDAP